MNCHLCQKELDAYREGRLPAALRTQVENHLATCKKCAQSYKLQTLAERIIEKEKEMLPNVFLQTRIMAHIENSESSRNRVIPAWMRILKPALLAVLLAAAIFLGVVMGNIYEPSYNVKVPVELALMNDASIESIDLLSIE